MNKDILCKIDEINRIIENSAEYQKYLILKKQIEKNSELKKMINEVKLLQKDVVHHLNQKEKLANKMNELQSNPLYREYNNTIFEINNVYAIIENKINHYFQEKLN